MGKYLMTWCILIDYGCVCWNDHDARFIIFHQWGGTSIPEGKCVHNKKKNGHNVVHY